MDTFNLKISYPQKLAELQIAIQDTANNLDAKLIRSVFTGMVNHVSKVYSSYRKYFF